MQRDVTAKINLWHPDAKVPEYGTPLSAGFDLAVIEDVHLEPLEANVFHTGLIIQAPEDHMLLVVPRSSTFKKWKRVARQYRWHRRRRLLRSRR
jgi:dUTPase